VAFSFEKFIVFAVICNKSLEKLKKEIDTPQAIYGLMIISRSSCSHSNSMRLSAILRGKVKRHVFPLRDFVLMQPEPRMTGNQTNLRSLHISDIGYRTKNDI